MSSAKLVTIARAVNDGHLIVAAERASLELEMFGNDGDIRRAWNVDCPDAVEIVEVVAGIVEARRGDDRVVGSDRAAAVGDDSVILVMVSVRLARFFWYS